MFETSIASYHGSDPICQVFQKSIERQRRILRNSARLLDVVANRARHRNVVEHFNSEGARLRLEQAYA